MSQKYIKQIDNTNFLYPNNYLAEYDVNIIHDLKEQSVSGETTGFSVAISSNNLYLSFTYEWFLNNAEPFISNDGKLNILSLHLQTPDKKYYKPWICVGVIQRDNTALTYVTDTQNFVITPAMAGVSSFTSGKYYGEIRFIGKRAIFPVTDNATLTLPTPTPTPTPSSGTPTPTPTITPTSSPAAVGYTYSSVDYDSACSSGSTLSTVTLSGGTFCSASSVSSSTIFSISAGQNIWISYGGNYRSAQVRNPNIGVADFTDGGCTGCPGVTPTPTPSATPSYAVNVQLANTLVTFCGVTPVTKYSATGDVRYGGQLYNNPDLTSVVTGYTYVADYLYGTIYNMNYTSGLIGGTTGQNC